MIEMLTPEGAQVPAPRRPRSLRRRRRRDMRALVTGVALVVGVAWTIVLGAGVFLH
jgi:ferric-dicitrate binding protein FerR (iron transport regulator)